MTTPRSDKVAKILGIKPTDTRFFPMYEHAKNLEEELELSQENLRIMQRLYDAARTRELNIRNSTKGE